MDQDILKVLLSEEEIKARVQELGDRLYDRFKDKNPMFVGVLNGCFIFMADLVRAAQLKSEVEFIGLSSYKNATKSSGVVQITHDLQQDITGRDIVVIEDILDSGNTLYFLKNYFMTKGAASVTVVTLLDKPARRTKPIAADLAGFEVPDEFVVGYGLDYAQKYRNQFKSVFCRDMCVAENTLRGVLCRIVRFQRTTEAQNAANLSQKKRLCLFFESARRISH